MIRFTAILAASIIAVASISSSLSAKQPIVKRAAKAAQNYVGGTPENSVTLSDDKPLGRRTAAPPIRGNNANPIPPRSSGGGKLLSGIKPGNGLGAVRPRTPVRSPRGNATNSILPQAIQTGGQLISRLMESRGLSDNTEMPRSFNSGRRARGEIFDRMLPQANTGRQEYGGGYSDDSISLNEDNISPPGDPAAVESVPAPADNPLIPQASGDSGDLQANAPPDPPRAPVKTQVQPPTNNASQSLGDLLALDDTSKLKDYYEARARNQRKYNANRDKLIEDNFNFSPSGDLIDTVKRNLRDNPAFADAIIRNRQQFYIEEIAELRKLEETIIFEDFARQRIETLKDSFKKEQALFKLLLKDP